jgi:hypothetical protein
MKNALGKADARTDNTASEAVYAEAAGTGTGISTAHCPGCVRPAQQDQVYVQVQAQVQLRLG